MWRPFIVALTFVICCAPNGAAKGGALQAQKFDLLIRGGHVIDPRNGIDSVMDVAIAGATIAAVSRGIDPAEARRVADATGLYVVPGLIDLHAHVFYGTESDSYLSAGDVAIQPDAHAIRTGVTTIVDAGGAGWRNVRQFKEQIIDRSKTRVLALLNIVGSGMKGGPIEQDLSDMDARLTAMRIREHRSLIVGIKTAHYRGPEWDPVDRAVAAGKLAEVPVMVDFGDFRSERPFADLVLKHLRPELGHLSVGAPADVTVLRLHRGTFGFIDVLGGRKMGTQKLEAELTVREGRVLWDLNGISHVDWQDLAKTP
jgi:dihydroorotase